MTTMLAAIDPWRWQPHVEVWFLVGSYIALATYAVRVIGPKAVRPGQPVTTGHQKVAFVCSVVVLWLASDWPMHDLAEEQLYFVHMVQHFLLTLVLPPLVLIATPEWLARLVLGGDGVVARWVKRLTRPVPALLIFVGLVMISHWPQWVNLTIEVGSLHYLAHLVLVLGALGAWMPVCNPLPERRISLPGQMVYLFVLSIVPTVPSAWMILAEHPLYDVYDDGTSFWGMDTVTDQQAAGLFMKLMGGVYLWTIITSIFFRWAGRNEEADRERRVVHAYEVEREVLTWDDVSRELEHAGPPPPSPDR
jgi:putative membrane protein